jgi:hypothetical protein
LSVIAIPRRILGVIGLFSFRDGLEGMRGRIFGWEGSEVISAMGVLALLDAMVLHAEPELARRLATRHERIVAYIGVRRIAGSTVGGRVPEEPTI